ncbi:retinol dehydrogenase 12 [Zea mays]|uniref:Retinol dehydrogenase 12 n=1 Tax=Zea mays TaxID=4577 RepID=B6UB33_MAIZE|nr:retinol dehydrogenase 12 [Zea mays]ACG46566.1 retinol dehydrogenase 12 [Zea mays]ONL92922.1 Retinol dehydrogenase 12 [Zea mays]|eukprot:NP_001152242.1 retinol dehydrogenase 12 [Zea mays]
MLRAARYLLGSPGASGFGSRSTAEEVTPDLGATTAIITGATSGIGAETARVLAKRGARVVIPARSAKAAEDVRARIVAECPAAAVLVLPLDLSSLASVRAFADRFLALGLPLHLLINNAGKFSHGQLALSEDGVEMTFATNYLGHFLLTKLLAGRMAETAAATGVQGRIVNVSSSVHGWFAGDWAEYLHLVTRRKIPYDATQAYAVSKLANVLHTRELAARLQEMGANVTANCVHPGIVRTRLNRDRDGVLTDLVFLLLSKLLKTIPQAAATTCYVAAHPRVAGVSGRYFADCNEALPSPAATDRHEAARLWRVSEAIIDGCTNSQPQRDCTTAPLPRLLPAQTQSQSPTGASSSPRRRAC